MNKITFRSAFFFILFSLLLFQSCKKEEDEVHPEVQTLELTALSPSRAMLRGKVVNKGKYNITDYGFMYGFTPDLSEYNGLKLSLGKDAPAGDFSKEVTELNNMYNNYYYDRTLYARAYLTNERGTVFGQVASVMLPSPNVQSIVPASGRAGDRITINGQFFASSPGEVNVKFANISARVVEVSSSKIVVEVPVGITDNYYSYSYNYNQIPVVITMGNQNLNVTSSFRLIPTVRDFAPKSGPIGTTLTISGDNLPNSYYNYYQTLRVYLGDVEASVSSYNSSGSFQVVVPSTISTKTFAISVLINGVTTVLPGEYTVTAPTISSISPASGLPGSTFSLFGSNFPYYYSYYYNNDLNVKIGDIPAAVQSVSTGQISVMVPQDMPAGNYKVTLTVGPNTVEAPQQYKVTSPSVTGFSPSSGGVGKEVTINGTFLPGAYYDVYFGTVATNAYSVSAGSLKATVPAGISAGKVKITVQHGSQKIAADDDFTVLAPSIVSFSPSTGVAGTAVTINVAGFTPSTYYYYTTVKFGTTETPVISVGENTIRAMVPSGVTGSMKISVTHNGQTIISEDNFTVTN
ncbi:IPT/TIG domain-containing protein [Pontibacter sp. SGAir0037]|uniref:IPT/TIG domain-containing protein n=1 Tax=Pontibacter sp. SGAir0037 TaxID=2571030 RepID=UPI00143DF7FE|nr:IPT/TIG domain-containing protein [Pontibacter sp. SGAir0037]